MAETPSYEAMKKRQNPNYTGLTDWLRSIPHGEVREMPRALYEGRKTSPAQLVSSSVNMADDLHKGAYSTRIIHGHVFVVRWREEDRHD